ncbi:MAG: hypothetical protein QMD95_01165 [Candidatus Hodarchaeaceae archaeon]|nr:hypothetical protein [Candidatus Hodarchaeaceae archaeon]
MAASVKLSKRAKRILDNLQTEATQKTGRRVSKQELIELVLDEIKRRKEELISKISERARTPLSEEEIKKILSLSSDWGVVTSEDEIDKYLYGKE